MTWSGQDYRAVTGTGQTYYLTSLRISQVPGFTQHPGGGKYLDN